MNMVEDVIFPYGNSSFGAAKELVGGANEQLYPEESLYERVLQTGLTASKFYTPLLCLVGIMGNSLSVAVFCSDPKYRSQSASLYLSALAISDAGFLLSLLAVWLEQVIPGGGILTFSDYSCSLVMYLGQVTCFLSVYLTVAFSIERFVAVRCPFSRPRICTRAKAKKCVACLTITALMIFSYAWLIAKVIKFPSSRNNVSPETGDVESGYAGSATSVNMSGGGLHAPENSSGVSSSDYDMGNKSTDDDHDHDNTSYLASGSGRYVCSVPEEFFKVSEIANYIDTMITLIIPFFLISFFNIQIARSVLSINGQRKGIVAKIPTSRRSSKDSDITCHYIAKTNSVKIDIAKRGKFQIYIPHSPRKLLKSNKNEDDDGHATPLEVESAVNRATFKSRLAVGSPTLSMSTRRSLTPSCSSSKVQYISPEVRVAKTLLLVSTTFLMLNLPSHVIRCAQFIQTVTGSQGGNEFLRALQPWSNILFNTSFAVNFLLYCLSGKNFRLSLHNLFLRACGRGGSPHYNYNYNHSHYTTQSTAIKSRLNVPSVSHHPPPCCGTTFSNGNYLRIDLDTTMDADQSYSASCLNLMNSHSHQSEQIVPV